MATRAVLECIHEVNLREPCPDCEADTMQPHLRVVVDSFIVREIDRAFVADPRDGTDWAHVG